MPIKIFLREDYPHKAPMVFLITPIPGMHFWMPKHLSVDGKIQIEYLTNWGKRVSNFRFYIFFFLYLHLIRLSTKSNFNLFEFTGRSY